MSNFIICFLAVVFCLLKPITASAGGKDDAPDYKQISPESTMTESQKAMQQYLTALGKLGYEEGTKAFALDKQKRDRRFYEATLAAIQNGGIGMNPMAINAETAAEPKVEAKVEEKKPEQTGFVPDPDLENAANTYLVSKRSGMKLNPLALNDGRTTIYEVQDYLRKKEAALAREAADKGTAGPSGNRFGSTSWQVPT